jgi:diguanylate cyclase (GGDEF)-like protein
MWLVFMLSCRPDGNVTRLIFLGSCGLLLATSQDLLDEFFTMQEPDWMFNALESVPAIIGISILCLGLSRWAEEQRVLNLQLQKQEKFYREHASIDFVTGLYNAKYLQDQLQRELSYDRPCALLVIDIDGFSTLSERFGDQEANRLLQHVGQVLQLGMRQSDLLCRYAGDRFVALLTNCDSATARKQADDMLVSSNNIGYRHSQSQNTVDISLCIGIASSYPIDEVDGMINRAINALSQAKRCGKRTVQVAA